MSHYHHHKKSNTGLPFLCLIAGIAFICLCIWIFNDYHNKHNVINIPIVSNNLVDNTYTTNNDTSQSVNIDNKTSYIPSHTNKSSYIRSYDNTYSSTIRVKGYYRKDGTYVRPHSRHRK